MKDMHKREAVIAVAFPLAAMLLTGAAIGLLWPLFSWWTLFLTLFPIAVSLTAHPLYRLVLRPRRIRRFLRKLGIPARQAGERAVSLERFTGRDFTKWENPMLLLAVHNNYSGYPWMWDVYEKLVPYDLGADWEQFFQKVWKQIPSRNFVEESKVAQAVPFLELLVEGKTNVVDLGRLMQSELSLDAVLAVVRDDIPLEYAGAL